MCKRNKRGAVTQLDTADCHWLIRVMDWSRPIEILKTGPGLLIAWYFDIFIRYGLRSGAVLRRPGRMCQCWLQYHNCKNSSSIGVGDMIFQHMSLARSAPLSTSGHFQLVLQSPRGWLSMTDSCTLDEGHTSSQLIEYRVLCTSYFHTT